MTNVYASAHVACDVNACDLCTRSLAGDDTLSLDNRRRVCFRRAADEIGDLFIVRYEERVFGSWLSIEFVQVGNGVFTPSAMCVLLALFFCCRCGLPSARRSCSPHSRFRSRRVSGPTSQAQRCYVGAILLSLFVRQAFVADSARCCRYRFSLAVTVVEYDCRVVGLSCCPYYTVGVVVARLWALLQYKLL